MRRVLLCVAALAFLAPFAWMVNASLKPEGQAVLSSLTLVRHPQWSNYPKALREMGSFPRLLLNTVMVTVASIACQLLTCSLAGYAFARLRFPGREALFLLVLATMMLPLQVTVIPQFIVFQGVGWVDTFFPLIAPCLFGGSPFFIFLFRQAFLAIPRDVVEAARLDGCGWWGVYWRILLPLVRPVVSTVAIFAFLGVWNDLWTPLIYLHSAERSTLTLALAGMSRVYGLHVETLMAASTVVLLPCLLVYFLAQRYFVQGVALTAGKG